MLQIFVSLGLASLVFSAIIPGVSSHPNDDRTLQSILTPRDGKPDGRLGPLLKFPDPSMIMRQKVTYGPFTVPPINLDDGKVEVSLVHATIPCDDCLITRIVAGLESPDGQTVNAQDGKWLHHLVLTNAQHSNVICPHQPEKFFASGNERTVVQFPKNNGIQIGYKIDAGEAVQLTAELMNGKSTTDSNIFITIVFDFIHLVDKMEPVQLVTPVWLDVGNVDGTCVASKVPGILNSAFTIPSRPWVSTIEGDIVLAGGHIHDGGINADLAIDGHVLCSSRATYGAPVGDAPLNRIDDIEPTPVLDDTTRVDNEHRPEGHMNMSVGLNMKGRHISSMSVCRNVGTLRIGNQLTITASYDTRQHLPMVRADASPEPIMGIIIMYVTNAVPPH